MSCDYHPPKKKVNILVSIFSPFFFFCKLCGMIEGPNSFLQKQSYCVYNSHTIKFTDLDTIQQFLVNLQLGNHIYDLDLIFFFCAIR